MEKMQKTESKAPGLEIVKEDFPVRGLDCANEAKFIRKALGGKDCSFIEPDEVGPSWGEFLIGVLAAPLNRKPTA